VLAGLGGAVLGLMAAALGTGAGRGLVVQAGLDFANRALAGSLRVGRVGGSFARGLLLEELVLADSSGTPVVRLPRAELGYRLWDLLGGRLVLGHLRLDHPEVRLIEDAGGRFSLERVLRMDRPSSGTSRPLIAFRDVAIEGGDLRIRTGPGPDAQPSERIVTVSKARLAYLRLSSPLPGEESLRCDVDALEATISEPALALRGMRGRIELRQDSLWLDLEQVRLPGTAASLRGVLRWPADTLLFDLTARASALATEDLQWLMPELPAGLVGSGVARIRSRSGDVLEVALGDLRLAGRGEGGSLRGRLGLVLGPGRHRTLLATDLETDDFDLEYVRPLLDTLPIAGRLSGRFRGEGPEEHLAVAVEWTFRDSLVAGWPASHLVADGVIALGVPGDFVFQQVAIREARLDLGTVRRLVPIGLLGSLDAAGTLNGPWREVAFSGTLRHHDGPLPPTQARGVLRWDGRRRPIGLWADLSLDSLAFEGLQSSFPLVQVRGTLGGDLRLSGALDSLALEAHLAGPSGRFRAAGVLFVADTGWGARDLEVAFSGLDLGRLASAWPSSSLRGAIRGRFRLDSARAPLVAGRLDLSASQLAGVALDSLAARFRVRDSSLAIDTLVLLAPEGLLQARGAIGLGTGGSDSLTVTARSDSLGALAPLVRWLDPSLAPAEEAASGTLEARATLAGTIANLTLGLDTRLGVLHWGPLHLRGAAMQVRWHSRQAGFALEMRADSAAWQRFGAAALEARAAGRPDSFGWFTRGRWGDHAAWIAGGRLGREAGVALAVVDSLGLLLPSEAWFLDRGARLTIRDSLIALDSVALASASGGGRIVARGSVPGEAPGELRLSVEQLPLRDIWAALQLNPQDIEGTLSGTLRLAGRAAAPSMEGRLGLQQLAFRGFRAPYLDGEFHYAAERLGGQFALWQGGEPVLTLSVELPFDLALRDAPAERRRPGPLSIRVRADSVDLGFLEAMIPVARQTAGRLWADFGIAGTWERPQLTGAVTVRDGAATFPALGVRHHGLYARLRLVGDSILVDSLSVSSGDGVAVVGGLVRLAELTRPLLDLSIRADNFRMMDLRDYLSFTASGAVTLTGPVYGAVLTGSGSVPRGMLSFTDLIAKQVISLEDTRYADIVDTSWVRRQGLGEAFQNRFLDSLRVDSLILTMGSDVWMRSSEANVQLAGRLTVSKRGGRYRLDGTLETPRGTYRLPLTSGVTTEFVVTRGQLQYFGTPDLNAAVDIEARHVVRQRDQNITVTVHIGGTVYTPKLTFTSDIRPPISETEIISLLLFGTSSFQALAENARNADLLRTTMSRLAASRLAGAVSGQLERSLITDLGIPLDFVQIRPGEGLGSGGAGPLAGMEIALGKQMSLFGLPAFVTASPRICPQQTLGVDVGASAELRVGSHWLLAASRDPVGSCGFVAPLGLPVRYQFGLDLLWERSY